MNRIHNFFLAFLLFCSSAVVYGAIDMKSTLCYEERLLYKIIDATAKQLYEKYALYCIGEGGSDDQEGKLKEVNLYFQTDKFLSQGEGARIAIDAARILVDNVNKDKALRPYLSSYPFAVTNVSVTLILPEPEKPFNFSLFAIRFSENSICYLFEDSQDSHDIYSSFGVNESYEEAVQRHHIYSN